MNKYDENIRLGMSLPRSGDRGSEVLDLGGAMVEFERRIHRNQQILRKLEACAMSFADLEPSRQLVEDVRSAGLYVCPICFTVDDPDLWGDGRDYRPACHCED
jgi:hypothetical protein